MLKKYHTDCFVTLAKTIKLVIIGGGIGAALPPQFLHPLSKMLGHCERSEANLKI